MIKIDKNPFNNPNFVLGILKNYLQKFRFYRIDTDNISVIYKKEDDFRVIYEVVIEKEI